MIRLAGMSAVVACSIVAPVYGADGNMFAGKTISYLVSAGPGGGYDTYSRLIARYMEKYLSGSRVVVRNIPSASAIKGANMIYAAEPDGLTIGMFNPGLIYDQLLHRNGVMFDLAKFSWIGKAAVDTRAILISNASGFKSFDDMLKSKTRIKFATADIGSSNYIDLQIIADALRLNLQAIPGFTGNEGEMSMLRKEVMAEEGTADSMQSFVDAGHGFWGLVVAGDPAVLPGVPRATNYAKGERARRLLALVETVSNLARPTAGPPGIPAEIVAAERKAMMDVVRDPKFILEARKLMLPIDPLPGDVVEEKIKQALDQDSQTIGFLRQVTHDK